MWNILKIKINLIYTANIEEKEWNSIGKWFIKKKKKKISSFKPHLLALYRQMVSEESTDADVMSHCYVFMSYTRSYALIMIEYG